jgi:hypothetical protein
MLDLKARNPPECGRFRTDRDIELKCASGVSTGTSRVALTRPEMQRYHCVACMLTTGEI